jgi:hypothetical protein
LIPLRWSALLLAGLVLAGCAAANPEEVRRAQAEADRYSCLEQGFEEGGENFALCRLIMQTNRRLDAVASRLAFVESDINRLDLLGRPLGWRRW